LLKSGPTCDKARIDASESLSAVSAKVWLAEVSKGLTAANGRPCEHCLGEWSSPQDEIPEIKNERWEIRDEPYAKYGRKAPYLTKLKIFGAFINAEGDEFIPVGKRQRAKSIYELGWS
jgi:hypothetical protein